MTFSEDRRHWLLLAAIFLLAAALRLHNLGLQPLWLDEAFSVWFTDQNWHYLWTIVPTFETHPPFYYSLLKIWRGITGSSEFELRMLSVVFALATFPLAYLSGRISGGPRHGRAVGLLAAFFFATLKLETFYAQDARPYTGFVLAMAIAVTGAVWLIRNPLAAEQPVTKLSWRALLAYASLAVGIALLQWFQNLGFIFILPIGLFLIVWWAAARRYNRTLFVNLLFTVLLAIAIYAPFIMRFIMQMTVFKAGFWLTAPTLTYLISQSERLFGQSLDSMVPALRLAIYGLTIFPVFLYGIYQLLRPGGNDTTQRPVAAFLLVAALGPWLLNLALTYTLQPVFMERTMLPLQFPWLVLLAMLPFGATVKPRRIMLGLLIVVFTAGAGEFWFLKNTAPNDQPHSWRAIAETIAADDAAPVIVEPNAWALPLYYYEKRLGVHFNLHELPAPFPAMDPRYDYPVGGRCVPAVTQASVAALMARIGTKPRLWLVKGGQADSQAKGQTTPDLNDPQDLVGHALQSRHYRAVTKIAGRDATLLLFTK